MEFNEFRLILCNLFYNSIIEDTILAFTTYKNFIQQENDKYNLSNICDDEHIFSDYFLNSLLPFEGLDLNEKSLLDIGSGSGIPGVALKIIFPKMKLTILESNQKRVNFMKMLCNKLGFDDVIFWNQRAEEIKSNQYELFDYVTSRAVANLAILLEISCQYLKIGGLLIEPKSNNYLNEYDVIESKIDDFGLKLNKIDKQEGFNNHQINTFFFEKTHKSNKMFPRKWKDIIKDYK